MSAAGEQRGYFVHLEPAEMASFVKRDYEILASRFEMHRHFYQGTLHALADRAATYLGTIRSDFTFSWFAYLQAYWAVRYSQRLEKKSVVVLGGFDVCRDEDPQLADRLESVRFILRNADGLFAVSERVRQQALEIVQTARQQVMQTLSVSPAQITQRPPKSRMNQAEVAMEQQMDILTTADAVVTLEEGVLSPMLQRFIEMDHQFREDELLIPAYGVMGQRLKLETIQPIQMDKRWHILWYGVEAAKNAQQIQQ